MTITEAMMAMTAIAVGAPFLHRMLERRALPPPVWPAPMPPQPPMGAPAASAGEHAELKAKVAELEARIVRQDDVIKHGLQEMRSLLRPLRESIVRAQNEQRDRRGN